MESIRHTSSSNDDELLQSYIIMNESMVTNLIQTLWDFAALESVQKHLTHTQDVELFQKVEKTLDELQVSVAEGIRDIIGARWLKPDDPAMHTIEDELLELLSTVPLLRVSRIDYNLLDTLRKKITDRRVVHNLWKIFRPREQYSSHLALRLAHYYAATKQREKVEPLLMRVIDFLTEDYLLPEFVNIRSFGGDEGIGASVIAATDLILLLRDMILVEEGSNLILLQGIPDEWFTAKRPLIIDALLTSLGPVHVEIGSSANQHQIEVNLEELPDEFEFYVPSSIPLPMMKAYGASIVERASKVASPYLRVVPHSNDIVLTFHK
ncbi:hypothetical protein EU527_17260 [Candidatus Thorarchaeota archaeon]|nr:MAG: hypothetical protein EU527_17260 [Candidatus Thorarchaeota archaeon]